MNAAEFPKSGSPRRTTAAITTATATKFFTTATATKFSAFI
jgi:hypothetical protein